MPLTARIKWIVNDTIVMTRRNVLRYVRLPQLVFFSTVQPVMFILLFNYVFGGSIEAGTGGVSYINYLLPGIFIQTALFGSTQTGVGLADDLSKGMVSRFRSLPMAPSAVLLGRTISDAIRNVFVVILMVLVGLVVGFRFQGDVFDFLTMISLIVSFGFAFSWISATIGMALRNPEAAQVSSFVWIFPMAFISSIFVPIEKMADGLQTFARYSPVTAAVNANRALALGVPVGDTIKETFAWVVLILLVFVPIAVSKYRKVS